MNNPVKILNYATSVNNYVTLYTEIPHDFVVGDTIYINGGYYDNTKNLVDTFIEYTESNGTFVANDIFSFINGYKIVDTHIVGSDMFAFTINVLTSPSTLVYPYGTQQNRFGFLEDYYNDNSSPEMLAYNNRINNLEHSEIYAYKKGIFNSIGVFTHIEDHMIGIRDNDNIYSNVSIDNPYDIGNNPVLDLHIQRCCIQRATLINVIYGDFGLDTQPDPMLLYKNKLEIREHLDSNDPTNPNTFALLPIVNTYYPISRMDNGSIIGCYVYCANFYNPKGDCNFIGGAIFDSIIGNNGLYYDTTTIKNNDTQIHRSNTYSLIQDPLNINTLQISRGELLIYKKLNNPKPITNDDWTHDNSTNELTIEIEVPTQDLYKCNLEIDENLFKYKIDGLTIQTKDVLEFSDDHIILQKVNNLNYYYCSIKDYKINQNSYWSSISIIVKNIFDEPISIEFDSINSFIKLYTPTETFFDVSISTISKLDIYYNPVMSHPIVGCNFIGGYYRNCEVGAYKINGTKHSNVYFDDTVNFTNYHIKDETDPSNINHNTINWAYIENNSSIYTFDISNSVIISSIPKTLKIINVEIKDSLIRDSFVYNSTLKNTRGFECLWDMCNIESITSNNISKVYGTFDISDLNTFYIAKPVVPTYFENSTSRRSSQNPFYEFNTISGNQNMRNSTYHKARNYTMSKTGNGLNPIISLPVNVISNQYVNTNYDGDIILGTYNGGTYNSIGLNTNLDVPVIKYNPITPVGYKLPNTDDDNYNIYTFGVYTNNTSAWALDEFKLLNIDHSASGDDKTIYYKKGVEVIVPFTASDYSIFNSVPGLSSTHPAQTISIGGGNTEIIPYKPLDKFIKPVPYLFGNKVEFYATNIIESDLYWFNISGMGNFNPVNVEDNLNIDESIINKITFSGYGDIVDVTPNNTSINNVSIGLNTISIEFNNSIFDGLNTSEHATVTNNLYEVERIYVFDITNVTTTDELIGETILTRSSIKNKYSLNERYTLDPYATGATYFGNTVDLTNDNGGILNVYIEENKTYVIYFDIWVTPSHVTPSHVGDSSYNDPNNLYNTYEKTNISGSYSRFVRVAVTVTGTIEALSLLGKNNSGIIDYIFTENDEKIIIN